MKKLVFYLITLSLVLSACARKDLESQHTPQNSFELPSPHDVTAEIPLYNLRLMRYSLIFINSQYYDQSRVNWQKMAAYGVDALQKMVPEMVARFDKRLNDVPQSADIRINDVLRNFDFTGVKTLVDAHKLCVDIFNFVYPKIADPEDAADLEYAMINGMFTTLDPHTNLLTPRVFDEMMTSHIGFAGLGFVVGVREAGLMVISPIAGAPADRAGIKQGDRILRIDGESTENMPVQDAVDRMRGKAGTKVELLVMRKSWKEARNFEIIREDIKVSSVTSKALKRENIAYIRVKSFDQNTTKEMLEHLQLMHDAMPNFSGLILDLRGNSGGLLMQAIELAGLFLKKGDSVVTVEGLAGTQRDSAKAKRNGVEQGYPMVVLMDGGSASASEILAGALQHHERALVLGERSFGKGSVQTLKQNDDRSAIKVTTAQYLTPGDVSIQAVGIVPNIEFKPIFASELKSIALTPSTKSRREQDLRESLHSDKTLERQSERKLLYLYEESEAEKQKAKDLDLSVYDLRSTADYYEDALTRFATDLLRQAKDANASELMQNSATFFEKYDAAFAKNLSTKLRNMQIDWSKTAKESCTEFSWQIAAVGAESNDELALKAGEKNELRMKIKNLCENADLERFNAVLSSNNYSLDELEFVFGRVKAGQEAEFSRSVELSKASDARKDLVELKFYSDGVKLDKDASFITSTSSNPSPQLAYSLWFDDSEGGNGDGLLQRGETVDVYVWVMNESQVQAEALDVIISNASGRNILLLKGKDSIATLAPMASHSFALRFKLNEDEVLSGVAARGGKQKTYKANEAALDLSIESSDSKIKLMQSLKLPISATKATEPRDTAILPVERLGAQAKKSCISKSDENNSLTPCGILRAPYVEYQTDAFSSKEESVRVEAIIRDDTALKDYQAYVWSLNGLDFQIQKIDFALLSGKEAKISIDVPLQIGDNTLSIVARDNDKLEKHASLHILRLEN